MQKLREIRVPGVAWVALIMVFVAWLEGDWFAGEPWVPGAVLILTTVAKLLQMYVFAGENDQTITRYATDDAIGGAGPGRVFEFFWG